MIAPPTEPPSMIAPPTEPPSMIAPPPMKEDPPSITDPAPPSMITPPAEPASKPWITDPPTGAPNTGALTAGAAIAPQPELTITGTWIVLGTRVQTW